MGHRSRRDGERLRGRPQSECLRTESETPRPETGALFESRKKPHCLEHGFCTWVHRVLEGVGCIIDPFADQRETRPSLPSSSI